MSCKKEISEETFFHSYGVFSTYVYTNTDQSYFGSRTKRFFWIIICSMFIIATAITLPIVLKNKPSESSIERTTISITTVTYTTVTTTTTTTTVSRNKPTIYNRSYITNDTVWIQDGITVAGGNKEGAGLNQFGILGDIYIDENETIYACDFSKNRLMKWPVDALVEEISTSPYGLEYPRDFVYDEENHRIIICNSQERTILQIFLDNFIADTILSEVDCYGIALDNENNLYISNDIDHNVKRWKLGSNESILVAGGNGKGNQSNQLTHPTSIFVDDQQTIYISDFGNRRIMKWKKNASQGQILATHANGLDQLESVGSIFVDHLENIYVSDWATHRVVRCNQERIRCETILGGRDTGSQANQLHFPAGLAMDKYGHFYVADRLNYRVQKFPIDFY